ncbi:MAG: hypothetical protein PHH77_10820 [Victivallaceae bacterium]|nr:hypothetical protein [Victivallaceae bacterium]
MYQPPRVKVSATPRERITYRLYAELIDSGAPDKTCKESITIILNWLWKECTENPPEELRRETAFLWEGKNNRVECVDIGSNGIWSMRWVCSGLKDMPKISGRSYIFDIGLHRVDDRVEFAFKSSCMVPWNDDEAIPYVRPSLIERLTTKPGLRQGRKLGTFSWLVDTPEKLSELESILYLPQRTLPVIVVSAPDANRWTYTPNVPLNSLIDCEWLAKQSLGYAHVVRLSFQMAFEFFHRIGRSWAVYDGAVRIYYPGLNTETDSLQDHPVYFKSYIWRCRYRDQHGPNAFAAQLISYMHLYKARLRGQFGQVLFVPDARLLSREIAAKEMTEGKACKRCRAFDILVEELKEQVASLKRENEYYTQEVHEAEAEAKKYRNQALNLLGQVDTLRLAVGKKSKTAFADIEIPAAYEELPQWVEKYLSGRLLLHPRAIRGIKDAMYESPQLVYKALLLLGFTYRDMRLGHSDRNNFDRECAELELRFSGSIARSRAGSEGEEYFVAYNGQRRFLEFHLRKGNSKDRRYSLAVYFFWDDEDGQVVVGDLPAHLDNRST